MPTILLADDSITIQKIVNLTFSGEGIDVVTVGNGDAALKKIQEIRPDVVLADIFMPGKNGYEVCDAVKNDAAMNSTPVILLVGAFEPFDANEASRVKADGHLTKPFEIKVLISAVNALIRHPKESSGPEETVVVELIEQVEETDVAPPTAIESDTFEPLPAMREAAVSWATVPEAETPSEPSISEPPASMPLGVTIEEMEPDVVAAAEPPPPIQSLRAERREMDLPPMPVIEESDPLGLLAADAQSSGPFTEDVTLDSRSLVVDIWDSRPAPGPALQQTAETPSDLAAAASLVATAEEAMAAAPVPELETAVSVAGEREVTAFSEALAKLHTPEFEAAESAVQPPQRVQAELAVPTAMPDVLSDEVIERIARRVVEKLSRDVIERIAWEVVPDLAELMIKDHVETHLKESRQH